MSSIVGCWQVFFTWFAREKIEGVLEALHERRTLFFVPRYQPTYFFHIDMSPNGFPTDATLHVGFC